VTSADPDWSAVKRVVAEALELPAETRDAHLDAECPDPAQRAEAARLLRWCERAAASPVLDLPAAQFAAPLLAEFRAREDELPEALRVGGGTPFGLPDRDSDERTGDADSLRLVGRTISDFEVIEPLAHGGMGVVYRALDTQLRRAVALKFPLPTSAVDRGVKERFLREARLAGALDHPNLCHVYAAGETEDGHLYYAMPLYEGETLRARIARAGALPIPDALDIARQIAQGLGAAHRAGIIHRDLKPANVMLLPDGGVKILDFGLARPDDKELTATRATMGTVSYMAPEQIRGRELDGRTDLWAVGVVLYEMLTGHRPFEGEHLVAVAHAIVYDEPVRPSRIRAEIPPDVDDLVCALLEKEPSRRVPSADSVVAVLAAALRSGPRALSSGMRHLAPPRTGRSNRLPRAIAIALLVLALTGLGGWLALRGTATQTPRAIAVVPFRDSSDDGASRYLSLGLSELITMELSRIRNVVAPGYHSTHAYSESARPLSEVADELGVTAIVTGSVERAADRVRVEARLFDAASDEQIWSRTFDRPLVEVRNVQRELTASIVSALRMDLSAAEQALMDRPLTTDARAYELFLRGREAELRDEPRSHRVPPSIVNIREAQSHYARARDIDPNFGLARARLAITLIEGAAGDTSQARHEQARLEAERALRLEPGMPEARYALWRYWSSGGRALQEGVEELQRATAEHPNRADMRLALGEAYLTVGRFDESLAELKVAMRLEPRDPRAPRQAALFLQRIRRGDEAHQAFNRALALTPDDHMLKVIKGHFFLRWTGNPDTLAAMLAEVPGDWDRGGMATYARYTVLRVRRRYPEALAMLDGSRSAISRDGLVYHPTSLMRAEIHEAMRDRPNARMHYETARAILVDSLAAHPDDPSIQAALGLAYAGLGRTDEAIQAATRAMELMPMDRSAMNATAFMGIAVEVFARVGQLDRAFELLDVLFSMPAGREVTVPFLRVWPGFDPLREDARFEPLLERFAG
jgi:eukaryotic-like serine/threonine-protein kinase